MFTNSKHAVPSSPSCPLFIGSEHGLMVEPSIKSRQRSREINFRITDKMVCELKPAAQKWRFVRFKSAGFIFEVRAFIVSGDAVPLLM